MGREMELRDGGEVKEAHVMKKGEEGRRNGTWRKEDGCTGGELKNIRREKVIDR